MDKEEAIKKPEGSDDEEDDQKEGQNQSTKKLSKGQKKKLKQLKKKQQEKKKLQETTQPTQQVPKSEQAVGQEDKKQQVQEQVEKTQPGKQGQKKQEKKDKKKKAPKLTPAAILAKKRLQDLQKFEQQQQRKRKQRQAQQQRQRLQQEQKKRKQQEQRDRIAKQQQDRIKKLKKQGLYLTKKQQQKMDRVKAQLEQMNKIKQQTQLAKQGKFQQTQQPQRQKTQQQLKRQEQKKQKVRKKQQKLLKDKKTDFQHIQGKHRSPVCCILGHVDTGKTTLLDKIRRTNVQQGQAGGITQQIGATFFPQSKLIQQVSKCKSILDVKVQVPGLLIIDTPGHQSFSNLRSRGSSLCDIAILVIDIQHGLQKQTLQSLQLLKKGNTPFVVALNKIDRSYSWQAHKDSCSYQSLKKQNSQALHDYKSKLQKVIRQLNQKGYNAALYWQNQDPQDYISLIPTSGVTGQGIPDLLAMIVNMSLTQQSILKRIQIIKNKFKCTVMQVKMIQGYGTTIDCLLVDGSIAKQDQIVLLGFNGPIITKVKALLTPHPMKQMRIKDQYIHHDIIVAANGVKLCANNLDNAVAGSPLIIANTQQQVQQAISICKEQLTNIQKKFKLQALGVGVSASTLGSLQALLEYLHSQKIPVSHISVGPVSKQDVIKAMKSLLSEVPERRKQQFACLLVFDVKVLADAQKYAEQNGIKIFTANIIYHLTDFFNKHVAAVRLARKQKQGKQAVFPCILKQVATFRKSDPIVLGVDVQAGVLKIGTPICIYKQKQKNGDKQIKIGVVQSIEHNHKKLNQARKKTGSVAISLGGDPSIMSGRHFDPKDMLVSIITRRSIDCLKEHFREEVAKEEWQLIVDLKKYFNVI